MRTKIPATVVTGFLGAGKTTLIRGMLENAQGRRIALVVNEFGDLGVDGEILRGCGVEGCAEDDIVELSNGCICCAVADDFVPAMERLLDRDDPPDHIVIETSGLALPQPLLRAFGWPGISSRATVDGVIAVIDGKAVSEGRFAHDVAAVDAQRAQDGNLDHESSLAELFEDQIASADMIVVNKADLLKDGEAAAIAGDLGRGSREGVQVVEASMGDLPLDVLLGRGAAAECELDARREVHHSHDHDEHDDHHDHEDDHHHDDHDHGHDAFESFVVSRGEVADAEAFAELAARVIREHEVLRLKGFAAVAGKPMRMALQAVGPRVDVHYDRPFGDDPRATRLVVIGRAGLDRAAIEAALQA